jgi:hypothetical protein
MIQDVSQIGAPAQTIHHVFVETPNLPSALRAAKDLGYPVDRDSAVYFWRAGWTAVAVAFATLRLLVPQLGASSRSAQSSATRLLRNWAPNRDPAEDLAHGADDLARDQA